MKKSLKTILILAATLALTSKSYAAVLNSDFIKEQIKENIQNSLDELNVKKAEIKIKSIPYKSITLPDGNVEIKNQTTIRNYSCASVFKTDIYVDGKRIKTFGTPVDIKIYDKVWVVKNRIKKGSILSYSNLALEEKQLNVFSKNALKKDFSPVGYAATRTLKTGDILNEKFVKQTPLIVKNSPVSIIFKTPYVSVTLPGMALEEGNIGDFIRVKNTRYRKNFVGKIVGNNIIKVNI